VIRSYVGVGELLNVAFSHLLREAGDPYDCFDAAGDREVEVFELAETVREIVNPDISITRPPWSFAEADRYVGDPAKFSSLASLYCVPLQDLRGQVFETAEYLDAL